MTAWADAVGIACCGNCGHSLKVVCSAGCEHPDVAFPRGRHYDARAICNWPGCDSEVGSRSRRGPLPTKCPKHRAMQRVYRERSRAKKAGG